MDDHRDDPDSLSPDRFHVLSDAGSVFFDAAHEDGFDSAEAALAWAVSQTEWPELPEWLADGVSAVIVLGSKHNACMAAWQAWADAGGDGPYPDVEVRNYAIEIGLVDR